MHGKGSVGGKHLKRKNEVSVLGGLLDARVESRVHSWRLKVGNLVYTFKPLRRTRRSPLRYVLCT